MRWSDLTGQKRQQQMTLGQFSEIHLEQFLTFVHRIKGVTVTTSRLKIFEW